jgi:DNA-binding IclR family transcriptional regulator
MSDGVPTAHHTLRVLSHLAQQRGPVTAASIATALGLPRSSVYRLLTAMETHGYAIRFPEIRRWGVGVAAFELSAGFARQAPLARLGRPLLANLVDRLGESAHLAALVGSDVIYLVEERAPRRPALVTDVGVRLPAHRMASGRALLATLPKSQLRALYRDAPAAAGRDGEPFRYSQLSRTLDEVRAAGFAAEDGDVTSGLASVAVAVRDHTGWPAAGITVTFARDRFPPGEWPALAETVAECAAELGRRIRGS